MRRDKEGVAAVDALSPSSKAMNTVQLTAGGTVTPDEANQDEVLAL